MNESMAKNQISNTVRRHTIRDILHAAVHSIYIDYSRIISLIEIWIWESEKCKIFAVVFKTYPSPLFWNLVLIQNSGYMMPGKELYIKLNFLLWSRPSRKKYKKINKN